MIRVSGVTVPLTQLIKLLTSSLILSLTLGVSASSLAEQGNAEAGKQKSATCAACHGADGNSPLDQFPKIAGQVPGYVAGQLHSFQSQERNNAIMMGMVGSLSDQDMADIDAFYASQEMSTGSISADQEVEARAGESIYRGGIAEFSVPACMGCHGPSGSGIAPNFPRLAGQHAAYIEAQLLAFKSGTRSNPIMQTIAFPLSAEQIKQLALYISALH
jgi:cytochrome c553